MKVISQKIILAYGKKNNESRKALRAWYDEVKQAHWFSPNDIKNRFADVSFLPGNEVCFNIKGNNYRIITLINYKEEIVLVKFIGTHAEYDKYIKK